MATRTRRKSSEMSHDEHDGMNGGSGEHHGLTKKISDGIRVTAEMPDPRVARITIDIDWQHLVARVARKMGRKITGRSSSSRSRASSTRRSSRSKAASSR